jgi:hypothetical protein
VGKKALKAGSWLRADERTELMRPSPTLVGITLVATSLVSFASSLLWPTWLVLPVAGLITFAVGCVVTGAGIRPRGSALLGSVLGAGLYVAIGAIWVVAWNSVFRFRGHIELLVVSDPVSLVVTVLTWPWGLLGAIRNLLT